MKKIRISIIQPEFKGWNFDYNFKKCEELVKKVIPDNPDLICLPELFPGRSLHHSEYLSNLEIPIFFGHSIPPKKENEKWYNAYSLKDSRNNVTSQLKLKLVKSEKKEYAQGKKNEIFELNTLKIGVSICHSFAFDSLNLFYYANKVDIIIVPALAPINHIDYWKFILTVRAIDLRLPIIFINYAGSFQDHGILSGGGNSSVVLPFPPNFQKLDNFVSNNNVSPKQNFLLNMDNNEAVATIDLPIYKYDFE